MAAPDKFLSACPNTQRSRIAKLLRKNDEKIDRATGSTKAPMVRQSSQTPVSL